MFEKVGLFENNKPIKVAIIGYGNIAKVHCKILNKFGAKINAVSCSTFESGINASEDIYKLFGYKPNVSIDIDEIITKYRPDCVFICTPPERHFNDIIDTLKHKVPIFCEKPLIWSKNSKKLKIENDLNTIKLFKDRKIFCNHANNNLLESLIKKALIKDEIKKFKFLFHTNGIFQNRDIGVDLLPHGIAMITSLLGDRYKIQNYFEKIEKNKFVCNFKFNNVEVSFDFAQSDSLKKKFQIQLNNRNFIRKDCEKKGAYKVWFIENENNHTYSMDNPFEIEVSKFLKFIKKDTIQRDNFINAFHNTKILCDILLN
tara:strand:+ start:1850 stop:2794 length:945 start_codon:yes stop_codon:yes gene_type:complete